MKKISVGTLFLAAAAALFLGGCTQVDGRAKYFVNGKLVNAAGHPVHDVTLAVTLGKDFLPNEESLDWQGFSKTKEDGSFSAVCYGSNWSYSLFLGLIPVGSTVPPSPDAIEDVYVFYRRHPDGKWHQKSVPVRDNAEKKTEPGKRWVRLGIIQVLGSSP